MKHFIILYFLLFTLNHIIEVDELHSNKVSESLILSFIDKRLSLLKFKIFKIKSMF